MEVEAWTAASGGGAAQVHWLVTDQLGTPRMVFDQSGSLANVSRHDYLPFGEEVPANFRSGIPGYGNGDNVRQKFTQKERDTETGLDYFGARYYGSVQGRFTSPDPITVLPERMIDPQQLNLYAYTRNNPLRFVDPNGLTISDERLNDKDKERLKKIRELANATDKNGNLLHPELKAALDKLDKNERTFYIVGAKLGAGTVGKFEIETFNGEKDFSTAVIKLDFSQIKDAPAGEAEYGGFKQFEKLITNEERFAEVFGHEATHAGDAIDNPAAAVHLQKLDSEVNPAILAANKARVPISPDIKLKLQEKDRLHKIDEKRAYGAEKLINLELRSREKKH